MSRWLSIVVRGAVTLVAVVCLAAATPLAAQQSSGPALQARTSAAQANSTSVSRPGPRVGSDWRSIEPNFARTTTAGAAAVPSDSHTITVTTLVLVLVVIIAVLLVAK